MKLEKEEKESKHVSFADHRERVLSDARVIHIYDGIDRVIAYNLSRILTYMEETDTKKPVTIYLNTGGGVIYDALAMYDRIELAKSRGVKVNIIANGACMSAGMIVLQAASKRQATPHTSFLLHELQGGMIGSMSQHEDFRKEAERLSDELLGILSKRSKLSKKELVKFSERKDYYFGVKDALKLNLIDEVVKG